MSMTFPLSLALTAAEFAACTALPGNCAWMACHYSCYSTGLSNCPDTLPPGAMLILNDRMPPCGHDPKLIAKQLSLLTEEVQASCVLLDFQRPELPENAAVARAVVETLSCPVGVSDLYARDLTCPVFLPPPPLHQPIKEYLHSWQGREIWLEAALDALQITVTPEGSRFAPVSPTPEIPGGFDEEKLHCRYRIETSREQGVFTLVRTPEHLQALFEEVQTLGVTKTVGLYQELGKCFQ